MLCVHLITGRSLTGARNCVGHLAATLPNAAEALCHCAARCLPTNWPICAGCSTDGRGNRGREMTLSTTASVSAPDRISVLEEPRVCWCQRHTLRTAGVHQAAGQPGLVQFLPTLCTCMSLVPAVDWTSCSCTAPVLESIDELLLGKQGWKTGNQRGVTELHVTANSTGLCCG